MNCCNNTNYVYPQMDLIRWETQCSSYMADADNYYTKYEVDNKLSEKLDASAYTPCDLSGYATEQWVENQGFLTEHQPLKTINGESLVGQGNITISGGDVDLSDYYNKQEVDSLINTITSRLIQNVTNLQQQINSIIANVSGCCAESGETQYRWITMTGSNDYWCDGTTKKTLEKQQSSNDGLNWVDTGTIRSGSTVLEYECAECGYDIDLGVKIIKSDNTSIEIDCSDLESVQCGGQTVIRLKKEHILSGVTNASDIKEVVVGSCVDQIHYDCFSGCTNLQKVVIPTTFISNAEQNCKEINVGALSFTAIRTVGLQGSGADVEWNDNMTMIAGQMFVGCTALTSVELNENFNYFQKDVFSGCTNLQSITIHSNELPVLNPTPIGQNDGLSNIGNNTFVIYVPSDMVDTYKNSTNQYKNWSKYASHIQPIQ